jgi:hypothetical protein
MLEAFKMHFTLGGIEMIAVIDAKSPGDAPERLARALPEAMDIRVADVWGNALDLADVTHLARTLSR